MGEHEVKTALDDAQLRSFMRALLEDLRALERMLDTGVFETNVRRIGAEQEMFLADRNGQPAPVAMEVLERLQDLPFTTELAKFNLEANLEPVEFGGTCLSQIERRLNELVSRAQQAASECGANVVLAGILPSLRQSDLGLDNMTPIPRYFALDQAIRGLRGEAFQTTIKGVDELTLTHDNVMLEACNTSFQIHFQVSPGEFAKLYNVAQAVTAPVLAVAVNSPVLLGKRLWRETRIALFQQSVDARSLVHQERGQRTRVSFGDAWIDQSILEIFREDIARFRVVLASGGDEKPMKMLDQGTPPPLTALRLHNGTVYRWNRPCYGIHEGRAHLRIENRALPAGPTVLDEVANAAFYFGLMSALTEEHGEIHRVMEFDDAKANFVAAARHGLTAQFTWIGGKTITAGDLVLHHLLPSARQGLERTQIASEDIDRYLGVIEDRVRAAQTGAKWMLTSLGRMGNHGTVDERMRTLVTAMVARQSEGRPVHTWEPATLEESDGWRASYRTVGQFMATDLFTVRPQDLVDLAACLMEWEHLRYVPVEDDQGRLVGLVSYRALLRMVGRGHDVCDDPVAVHTVMRTNPVTVTPETSTLEAIRLMREQKLGCLPVVREGKLVGIVTESDLLSVAAELLEAHLSQSGA